LPPSGLRFPPTRHLPVFFLHTPPCPRGPPPLHSPQPFFTRPTPIFGAGSFRVDAPFPPKSGFAQQPSSPPPPQTLLPCRALTDPNFLCSAMRSVKRFVPSTPNPTRPRRDRPFISQPSANVSDSGQRLAVPGCLLPATTNTPDIPFWSGGTRNVEPPETLKTPTFPPPQVDSVSYHTQIVFSPCGESWLCFSIEPVFSWPRPSFLALHLRPFSLILFFFPQPLESFEPVFSVFGVLGLPARCAVIPFPAVR